MSQTLALVFKSPTHELHVAVQQVEFTPLGIVTEDGLIATIVVRPGEPWAYQLTRDMPDNWYLFDSIEVHRLMPSGKELTDALSRFETERIPKTVSP